jgi:peptide deformylase
MILTVVQQPSSILRGRSVPIRKITEEIKRLAEDMVDTMYNYRGVGLAAPQVGQPIQMIVFDASPERDQPAALLNPEIVSHSKDLAEAIEGCLSCRGFEGKVRRYAKVTVKGLNLAGKKVTFKAEGILARVLQHEIDHLHGIIIMDKAIPLTPEELAALDYDDKSEDKII